jgi:hypothetical protein
MTDYDQMRADLMALTMRQLKEIARSEGICLGYDGSRKDTTVAAIVSFRRGNARKAYDWHTQGVTALGGIKRGWE